MMDDPRVNDNRRYIYHEGQVYARDEHPLICREVVSGASVLDLGCGEGTLLKLLADKGCRAEGVEASETGVEICRRKGLNVHLGPIDCGLSQFKDRQFDYAICNVTLQMVMYPERLLSEMRRVARVQIISFPNIGHYRNRFELMFCGRFPSHTLFGYKWYSTGHIHQLSISDFEAFCGDYGWRIRKFIPVLGGNPLRRLAMRAFPNLFVLTAIFVTEIPEFS